MLGKRYFNIFLWLCGGIFIINLLVMNEITTVWDGAEAFLLNQTSLWTDSTNKLFWHRTLGGIGLIIILAGSFFLGKKIFGRESTWLMIMIIASSLLLPNLAKVFSLDIWLFGIQWIGLLSLILFCKQPRWTWGILFYVSLIFSILIAPWNSILLFCITGIGLYFYHPQGKRMVFLSPWLGSLVLIGLFYVTGRLGNWESLLYFGTYTSGMGKYLLFSFLGLLPFLGFVLGGIADILKKVKKKEEFSIILGTALFGSLLSQSLILQALLALLIAKQFQLYFDKNYPFKTIVQIGAILQLLIAFGLSTFMMMKGFVEFGGVGFRAGAGFSIVYWICSFVGVIGLYAMSRPYLIGGPVLSALAATFLFWLLINPLLETKREVPKRLLKAIQNSDYERVDIYLNGRIDPGDKISWYISQLPGKKTAISGKKNWLAQLDQIQTGAEIFITKTKMDSIEIEKWEPIEIKGWNDKLRPIHYFLIK